MLKIIPKGLVDVVDVMKVAYEMGWITIRDGNCSYKVEGERDFWVTPAGVKKGQLKVDDLVRVLRGAAGGVLWASGCPTSELALHSALMKDLALESFSVLHVHAINIVAAMHCGYDLSALHKDFTELGARTRVGSSVPMLPPSSVALGEAVAARMVGQPVDVVGMIGHGVVAIGKTPWEAFEHIERLEHICDIVLRSGRMP